MVYYLLPSAPILHVHRDRAFVGGYGQMAIVASIVATGAGLHVAAYFIEHEPYQRLCNRAQCCHTSRRVSWIDQRSLLRPYSAVRLPPCVIANRDGSGGRACRHRVTRGSRYGGLPRYPDACARRCRRRL